MAKPTYAQLLELNQWIRKNSDTFYFQCTTRTVQESKLFPVSPYILLSYYNCFYRYPTLFKKVEEVISAEELGDRIRESTMSLNHISAAIITQFYTLGREELITLGLLKPTDAVEDVMYVYDFWKRLMLSYKRNDAHILNSDFGNRAQTLPERQLQVFEADAFGVTPGDRLHTALVKFLAQVSQYCFLSHCECRLGIHNQGPYKVGNNEMIIREFVDLAEGDYPWLDGVAENMPYNNLTIPVVMKDTDFDIVDDWASFEAKPGYDSNNIVAVGLYTSDYLSDGYIPVGMNDREELADTFEHLREVLHQATNDLWKVIAGWTRDQMLEAGALVYYSVAKDVAHIAGVYQQDDWFHIDERVQRFKPLMNDDYGQMMLAELVGYISLPTQQVNPYTMARWSNSPFHMEQGIPYSILANDEWTPSVGPMGPASTSLPPKTGLWQTSEGKLTLDELNARCREFVPTHAQKPYVYLDDWWIKYNFDRPEADELYRSTQKLSTNLRDRGASVTRADLGELAKG
jgi:hypothetical protein